VRGMKKYGFDLWYVLRCGATVEAESPQEAFEILQEDTSRLLDNVVQEKFEDVEVYECNDDGSRIPGTTDSLET
jgi:hypothetical protein